MGLSGGNKSTSTSGPAAFTAPYTQGALGETQSVYDANKGNLGAIGDAAIGAYNAIAPSAFGPNTFLQGAQQGSSNLAANAGKAYAGFGTGNPANDFLINGANGGYSIGTGADSAVAGGQYLNAQPSSQLYRDILGGSQLNGNPYLQNMIDQTSQNVTNAAGRTFASRGLGAGYSTPYADVLTRNLANSEGTLRYQNYNDAANRQLSAAGQSDAAFANERGLMDNASGRVLDANKFNSSQQLSAAQQLGSLYNQNQTLGLNAQQAADQTQLAALGQVPGLVNAQYAGVDPALSLLGAAAELPYVGVNSLANNIANLTGATNTSKTVTKGPGLGYSILGSAASGAGAAAAASDRRLKKNIQKIGEAPDGLGIYDFDYIDADRFGHGRQRGVMADEVAQLRPWALGPKIDGEYGSVIYSKLEAA